MMFILYRHMDILTGHDVRLEQTYSHMDILTGHDVRLEQTYRHMDILTGHDVHLEQTYRHMGIHVYPAMYDSNDPFLKLDFET